MKFIDVMILCPHCLAAGNIEGASEFSIKACEVAAASSQPTVICHAKLPATLGANIIISNDSNDEPAPPKEIEAQSVSQSVLESKLDLTPSRQYRASVDLSKLHRQKSIAHALLDGGISFNKPDSFKLENTSTPPLESAGALGIVKNLEHFKSVDFKHKSRNSDTVFVASLSFNKTPGVEPSQPKQSPPASPKLPKKKFFTLGKKSKLASGIDTDSDGDTDESKHHTPGVDALLPHSADENFSRKGIRQLSAKLKRNSISHLFGQSDIPSTSAESDESTEKKNGVVLKDAQAPISLAVLAPDVSLKDTCNLEAKFEDISLSSSNWVVAVADYVEDNFSFYIGQVLEVCTNISGFGC